MQGNIFTLQPEKAVEWLTDSLVERDTTKPIVSDWSCLRVRSPEPEQSEQSAGLSACPPALIDPQLADQLVAPVWGSCGHQLLHRELQGARVLSVTY